jgi:hypothetical protein
MVKAGNIAYELNLPQLNRCSSLQGSQGSSRVLLVERQLRPNRRQPKRLHLSVQGESFRQFLCHGLGSRRIARHGKGQCGFKAYGLTRGSQLQRL